MQALTDVVTSVAQDGFREDYIFVEKHENTRKKQNYAGNLVTKSQNKLMALILT